MSDTERALDVVDVNMLDIEAQIEGTLRVVNQLEHELTNLRSAAHSNLSHLSAGIQRAQRRLLALLEGCDALKDAISEATDNVERLRTIARDGDGRR